MAAILTMFLQTYFSYFRFGGCQEIGLYFPKKSSWSNPTQSPKVALYSPVVGHHELIVHFYSAVYSAVFSVKLAFKRYHRLNKKWQNYEGKMLHTHT